MWRFLIVLIFTFLVYNNLYSQCTVTLRADTTVCAGQPVRLTTTVNISGTPTYTWSSTPAGFTSNQASPTVSPTITTTYRLTVTGAGCLPPPTRQVVITVNPKPNARLTVSGTASTTFFNGDTTFYKCAQGAPSSIFTFQNASSPGNITNHTIIWGDGTPNFTSTANWTTQDHTYNVGSYTLSYIVRSPNGCLDTTRYKVFYGSIPGGGISSNGNTRGCSPSTFPFYINSTANNPPGTIYTVTFSDGSPPVIFSHPPPDTIYHTFNIGSCGYSSSSGTTTFQNSFSASFIAENPCNPPSAGSVIPIVISTAAASGFTFAPKDTICINNTITFTDISRGGDVIFTSATNSYCDSLPPRVWQIQPATGWNTSGLLGSLNGAIGGNYDPYSWTKGSSSLPVTFTVAGQYTIRMLSGNSCGPQDTITKTVCVQPIPIPSFTVPTPTCYPSTLTLTNTSNTLLNSCGTTTYNWVVAFQNSTCNPSGTFAFVNSTNATSINPSIRFDSAGVYRVTLTVTNACGPRSASQDITIKGPPKISLAPIATICSNGRSVTPALTFDNCYAASSPVTYAWSFPGGTPSSSTSANPGAINYNSSGTFTISVTVTNQCGNRTATTTFTNNPIPVANAGNDTTICVGKQAPLGGNPTGTGAPGLTYQWSASVGASPTNVANPTVSPTATTTYTVTVTSSNGCTATDQKLVTVNPLPNVTVNSPAICFGQSASLTASGASTYAWSVGTTPTTGPTVSVSPTATASFTVTGTNTTTGCTNTAVATVTVRALPAVSAGPDQQFCNNSTSVTVSGTPAGAGGTWSGNGVSSGGAFTPSTPGVGTWPLVYTYTDANNCTNRDTMLATVINPTIADAGTGFNRCVNAAVVNLNTTASPTPAGGTWSGTGVSGTSFTPSTAGAGNFILTYSIGSGTCLSTDTIRVTVNALPNVTVNSTTICSGQQTTLTANGATTYSWSPGGAATPTITVSPTSSITYTVSGTVTATGCINTAQGSITVNPLPTVNAGADQQFCNGTTPVALVGTPAGGTWTGTGVSGNSFTPSVAGVGTWPLVYTYTISGTGCTSRDTMLANVVAITTSNAGTGFSRCVDAPAVNLTTTANPTPAGGTWSSSAGGLSGSTFTPSAATASSVILTYSVGTGTCLSTDTIRVTVNPLPTIITVPDVICRGETANLSASGASTYAWSAGTTPSNTASVTATPTATTSYTVTATNTVTGCSATATAAVTVNPLPTVNAGADQQFCNGTTPVALSGTPAGGTWTGFGVSGNSFTPSVAGVGTWPLVYTYTIPATGCTNRDTMLANVIAITAANAGTGFARCVDAPAVNLTTTANPTPSGGTWSSSAGGLSGSNFTPANATAQNVILTYSIGSGTCLSTDTIRVTVNPLPTITTVPDVICRGETASISASGANAYAWSAGTTPSNVANVTATPTTTSTYTVTATNTNTGCSATATALVTVNPLPTVSAGPDQQYCNQGIVVTLVGSPANGTWSGNGVTSVGAFTPSTAGLGSWSLVYTFTDANNCLNRDTMVATVVNPTVANGGTDFALCITQPSLNLNTQQVPSPAGGTWAGTGVSGNNFTASAPGAGVHIIVYNVGSGTCLVRDTVQVTVNPQPVFSIAANAICAGDTATFTASNSALTYNWTGNSLIAATGTIVAANPIATGNYIAIGVDGTTGCRDTMSATLTVNPLPVVNAGPDVSLCNQPIAYTLAGYSPTTGGTGTWTGGMPVNSGTITPNGTGTFTLYYTFTNLNSCVATDSILVTVVDPAQVSAGVDFEVCITASSIALSTQQNPIPVGGTWSGPGVSSNNFNPAAAGAGVHQLIYIQGSGTCQVTDTLLATVYAQPIFTVPGDTICFGDTTTLTASNSGLIYNWNPGALTGVSNTFQPTTTTTYTVIGTNVTTGCRDTITSSIRVNPLPIVNAGPDITICNQPIAETLTGYTPTTGGTGIWGGSPQVTANGVFTPAGVDTLTLTYTFTDLNTCVSSDSIVVQVTDPPAVDAGANDTVCINNAPVLPFTIIPSFGGTWTGNGIVNASTGLFSPSVAGAGSQVLSLSFGSGTCRVTDTRVVFVRPLPTLTFNPTNPETCFQEPISITVSGADTYSWSPSTLLDTSLGATVTAILNITTTLQVEATDIYGCRDTIPLTVIVNPLPIVDAGPDTTVCNQPNINVQLSGSPVGGVWDGSTFISPQGVFSLAGNPQDTGTYRIRYTYTDAKGCIDSSFMNVNVIMPILAQAGPPDTFCLNNPAALLQGFLPSGGTFSGPGIIDAQTGRFNPSVAGAGSHAIVYTYGAGTCLTRDTVYMLVNALPAVNFTFNVTCIGQPTQFTDATVAQADSIIQWTWQFGDGGSSTLQNPLHTYQIYGQYIANLSITNSNGCINDTNIAVVIHPLPTPDFSNPSVGCPDSVIRFTLDTIDAAIYNWDFGDGSIGSGINPTHVYTASGTYTISLVAETQFGCQDSAFSSITIAERPVANFIAYPDSGCGPLKVTYRYIPQTTNLAFNFTWDFGNGEFSYDAIPRDTITYLPGNSGDTVYYVSLYVQSPQCQQIDIFRDTIRVYSAPRLDIQPDRFAGCSPLVVNFANNTTGLIDSIAVDMGDGTINTYSSVSDFSHEFLNLTNNDTVYKVFITAYNPCGVDVDTISITVFPNVVTAGFTVDPIAICPQRYFTITNTAQGAAYIYYDFGFGINPVSDVSATVKFASVIPGTYTIYQHVYSGDSCSYDVDSMQVTVYPVPESDFVATSATLSCAGPIEIIFENTSSDGVKYYWNYGDGDTTTVFQESHFYQEEGLYNVSLVVENQFGCTDTLVTPVPAEHRVNGLFIPNAFSPEFGDAKVREFKPAGRCVDSYHLRIFNNWGELVWESTKVENEQPAEGWNGRHILTGELLPQDVYTWKIEATFLDNEVWPGKEYKIGNYKQIGTVTLIR
jgi:PKD repeat protein